MVTPPSRAASDEIESKSYQSEISDKILSVESEKLSRNLKVMSIILVMNKFYINLIRMGLIYLMVSCAPPSDKATSSSTTTTTTTSTYPLYLSIQGLWENSASQSFSDASCFIPAGTTAGGAGSAVNCTVKVPELTLHYSDIKFTIGTNSATVCSAVGFIPYYFKRSSSAVFQPTGATAPSDCSGATTPVPTVCYSGAAKSMVTSFPTYTGLYFLPGITTAQTYTLKSSSTLGTSLSDDVPVKNTNTNVSNGLAAVDRATLINNATIQYVASSMVDYSIGCYDQYGNSIYSLKLLLIDTDGASDYFYDWNAN